VLLSEAVRDEIASSTTESEIGLNFLTSLMMEVGGPSTARKTAHGEGDPEVVCDRASRVVTFKNAGLPRVSGVNRLTPPLAEKTCER